ncbi:MAG: peptidyl-prolyl cis-trans isomerase [Muribaculaceae bacterium]|nr:peptidyl-prolyl cis-trans isomerase [Muribaculaceae bacterium]
MIHRFSAIACAATLLLSGCSGSGDAVIPEDAIASVGSSVLTRRDLARDMPVGLSPEDSTAFAKAYIRRWADRNLIESVAVSEVDIEEIDRLTQQYRRELIMNRYRRAMASEVGDSFAEDTLRAYYNEHRQSFRLERPMIKGIYIKVPVDARNVSQIKRLYRSNDPMDIDRLEKEANSAAIHYDYFRDQWIDLEQVENRIPLDFTPTEISALANRHYLETESQGFLYLLSISEYLPAGDYMPFEAARNIVRERLLTRRRQAYDAMLLDCLYKSSLASGKLILY